MMLERRRKERGSRHDVKEPPKRKGIQTRCRRATEKIGDLDTILESCKKEKGIQTRCLRVADGLGEQTTQREIGYAPVWRLGNANKLLE